MQIKDGVYRTSDLVEASVISMHGLTPALEHSGDRRVVLFVFDLRNEDEEFFSDLIGDIRTSKHHVEPKRFAREMRIVREQMYTFLDVDRDGRRLRT